jgi:hypothetical protein
MFEQEQTYISTIIFRRVHKSAIVTDQNFTEISGGCNSKKKKKHISSEKRTTRIILLFYLTLQKKNKYLNEAFHSNVPSLGSRLKVVMYPLWFTQSLVFEAVVQV